ncbi:hypothetical protein GOODEAATRI_024779 [Goodea atripinnis]|uniref:Uncharacterized protein n=1 Tax=Goodea atripinnis TaxID=208336 RepID=A0ABV0NEA3_9TELE
MPKPVGPGRKREYADLCLAAAGSPTDVVCNSRDFAGFYDSPCCSGRVSGLSSAQSPTHQHIDTETRLVAERRLLLCPLIAATLCVITGSLLYSISHANVPYIAPLAASSTDL